MKKRKYIVTVEYLEETKTTGEDGKETIIGLRKTKDIEVEAINGADAMDQIQKNKGYKIVRVR